VFRAIEVDPYSQGDQVRSNDTLQHVRKVRIGAPGENVRPRAGYRLIFQVIENKDSLIARCLDLYYKPEQASVLAHEVQRLAQLAEPSPSTDSN